MGYLVKPVLDENHPWKHERFTLRSWVDNGQPFAYEFGYVIWLGALVWTITFLANR